jgi:hypothetical protein
VVGDLMNLHRADWIGPAPKNGAPREEYRREKQYRRLASATREARKCAKSSAQRTGAMGKCLEFHGRKKFARMVIPRPAESSQMAKAAV